MLVKLAVNYPKSVYIRYTLCLQVTWPYLCRCKPDIARLFKQPKKTIRDKLLPAFLGIDTADIDHGFCEHLVCAVKQGGVGICNPMATAEIYYQTLVYACEYFEELLIVLGKFNQT